MRLKDAERVLRALNLIDTDECWHNLKRNPEDLPKVADTGYKYTDEPMDFSSTVLVLVSSEDDIYRSRYHALAYMNLTEGEWYDPRTQNYLLSSYSEKVIAWMYIPHFFELEDEDDD